MLRRRLLALMAASPVAVPAAAAGLQRAPEMQRIADRGELVVAMLGKDTPPFFMADAAGQPAGLDVDLAQEIGRQLGVAVRIQRSASSFNDVVAQVARGEADIGISKLSRTLARAQSVLFSEPYLTLRHALLLNRLRFASEAGSRGTPAALRDFRGTVGVLGGSSFQDYARRNFPAARIEPFDAWDAVVKAVAQGKVTAAYRDEFEVRRLLVADPGSSLHLRAVMLKDRVDTLGMAVGAEASTLCAYLNLFLAQRPVRLEVADLLKREAAGAHS